MPPRLSLLPWHSMCRTHRTSISAHHTRYCRGSRECCRRMERNRMRFSGVGSGAKRWDTRVTIEWDGLSPHNPCEPQTRASFRRRSDAAPWARPPSSQAPLRSGPAASSHERMGGAPKKERKKERKKDREGCPWARTPVRVGEVGH
eukprot:3937690-Rhodomonas_salina.1